MKEEEAHSEIESKKMAPYKCGCGLIFDSPIDYVKHKKETFNPSEIQTGVQLQKHLA